MEIHKPELCAFPLRAYLDATRDAIGQAALDDILRPYGVTPADFEDPNAWYSLEFVEVFITEMMRRCTEPGFLERATRRSFTPKYMGPILPLMRAFGSPLFAYQQTARAAARFNRVGTWVLLEGRPGFVRMAFRYHPGSPAEKSPLWCRIRAIQQGLVPVLFDQPPGQVVHTQCILNGAPECVYDVAWSDAPKRLDGLLGVAFGAAAGGLFAAQQDLQLVPLMLVVVGAALGGWFAGKLRIARAELSQRVNEIVEHNEALAVLTRTNEDRYAELLEAKTEVEKKVESRTAELREASSKLSETLNKLQEIDRAKTDFFNNVSHELRSPLTLILAPLEELVAGRQPPGGPAAAFEGMHRNASRLLRLINQLLDLAKIDAGEMKIVTAPVDLPGLLRGSLKNFEAAAQKKGVGLQLTAPERMPQVAADSSWIDSAVTNLVANALRLTPAGAGVRVNIVDHAERVTIEVSDDGPGIAPADRAKIFERFAQGDSSKRVIGGTGIGLALVREAMRLHGGDVRLDSELGKGSTFTLTLPRRGSSQSAETIARSQTSLPPAGVLVEDVTDVVSAADRVGPAYASSLALVVEDNPELRMFIADVLSTRYRVRAARDGVEGLELARTLRPDVVVSDVAMPEMDGYELCRRIRAQDETKSLPVLLVTARTELGSVLQGFEAGASDYLLKPFHAKELLARVDVHVRLRRLTAQLARQERLAALGSLAASVAHNVRNPLSALISGLPAIRSRLGASIDPATAELMGIMLDCAVRIERMTLDLLDLSRIDREVSGEFAPGAGLLACTRMLGSRLGQDVQLRTEVDDQAIASGRAGDMNHVFMNVIDNALRAVGTKGQIEVHGAVEDDFYVVTVADSGAGIELESRERVFEPFWTTRSAGEGTGLGLSIARQILEEHAGSIQADASPLGGALFTVRLPLRRAERAVA